MAVKISGSTGLEVKGLPYLVGQVCFFAMASAPTGFLVCDGSAVSRVTYAAAFAAMGTLYGVGDGSTTFNLPDLRGEFIRGADLGRGADSGRSIGSWQKGSILVGEDVNPSNSTNSAIIAGNPAPWGWDSPSASYVAGLTGSAATASNWALDSGSNYTLHCGVARPRNVALLPCVFVGV